jgi:hypothetical protein
LDIFPNEEDPNPYVVFATTWLLAMMLKHGGRTRNPWRHNLVQNGSTC